MAIHTHTLTAVTWRHIQCFNHINLSKTVTSQCKTPSVAFVPLVTPASRDSDAVQDCWVYQKDSERSDWPTYSTSTQTLTLRHVAPLLQILHALKKTYLEPCGFTHELQHVVREEIEEREHQPHCFQHNNVIPACTETVTGSASNWLMHHISSIHIYQSIHF